MQLSRVRIKHIKKLYNNKEYLNKLTRYALEEELSWYGVVFKSSDLKVEDLRSIYEIVILRTVKKYNL